MYKFTLAVRYLYRRRISYLALAAVALCVFIVVVVMTVMTGLVNDFEKKNHNFAGDCVVGTESLVGFPYYEDFVRILESQDFVEGVSATINSYALVEAGMAQHGFGVEIIGIDAARHGKATGFGQTLHYHKNDASRAFEPTSDANSPGFVIGVDIWLGRNSRGQYFYDPSPAAMPMAITCFPLTTKGALAKAGTDVANTKTFYFSDCSQSGLAKVDGEVIYLPFEDAQMLCGMTEPVKRASWLHIRFKPDVTPEEGSQKVRLLWEKFYSQTKDRPNAELLSQVRVQNWKEHRREFIAGMEKEQMMLTAMFALVGLTTVFIVFVVFYMIVSHKTRDIGVLKSIGASSGSVVALFLGFAAMLGAAGAVLGIAGGLLFLRNINGIEEWLFERFGFQLWNRTIYAIGEIPHRTDLTMILVVACCAILACLAGAVLPSAGRPAPDPLRVCR